MQRSNWLHAINADPIKCLNLPIPNTAIRSCGFGSTPWQYNQFERR
jgi:hypothetical protein